jgi:hypothetical protein
MKRNITILMVLAALHALPASAQRANPAAIQTPGYRTGEGPRNEKTTRGGPAPPPALPGSRAEPAAAAPAQRTPTDMPPTEALFDSINRGDLPGARDAISRGADLQGTNVLGLTPLELSVDLGRNEISFLLLSLRGSSGFSANRPTEAAAAPKPPTRAERVAAPQAERADRARRSQVAARPAIAPPPQAPRLFSGNGGAPNPQAGFLGFDAAR